MVRHPTDFGEIRDTVRLTLKLRFNCTEPQSLAALLFFQ